MCMYSISAKDAENYVGRKNTQFIDLREKEEYEESHIPTAINIPYEELENQLSCIDRNAVNILYCDRGSAGLLAARKLSQLGYNVMNIVGGFHAYRGQITS